MTVILLATAAVIVATATAIYVNLTRLVWAEGWIRHTLQVQLAIDRSLMSVIGAERAARGFVLTADGEFIEQYTTAVRDAQDALYTLQGLTRDNDEQQVRVQLLNKQMQPVLVWSSNLIAAAQSSATMDTAARKLATGQGYALTTAYRTYVQEMRREEETLLAERSGIAEQARRRSLIALGVVTAVSLLALPLLGFALRREAQRLADAKFAGIEASLGTTLRS